MITNQAEISRAKRVVVKVGSSSITGANEANLELIVDLAASLKREGVEVLVVSSGAIATASPLIGLTAKTDDLATSQALAAVGQAILMSRYEKSFKRHGLIPAQILLTVDNLDSSETSENAFRALERLIEINVVPVINENDTVATHEIRFGDNDQLAARVAKLAQADLLILLSDVDALYTKPPTEEGAERIERISFGQDLSQIQVSGTSTGYGTGGALTKLAAAQLATEAGIPVLLTATKNVPNLLRESVPHTWFEPKIQG
ncbi:MAG: glutamate 5-kinase [Actinomycetota bacterium]